MRPSGTPAYHEEKHKNEVPYNYKNSAAVDLVVGSTDMVVYAVEDGEYFKLVPSAKLAAALQILLRLVQMPRSSSNLCHAQASDVASGVAACEAELGSKGCDQVAACKLG